MTQRQWQTRTLAILPCWAMRDGGSRGSSWEGTSTPCCGVESCYSLNQGQQALTCKQQLKANAPPAPVASPGLDIWQKLCKLWTRKQGKPQMTGGQEAYFLCIAEPYYSGHPLDRDNVTWIRRWLYLKNQFPTQLLLEYFRIVAAPIIAWWLYSRVPTRTIRLYVFEIFVNFLQYIKFFWCNGGGLLYKWHTNQRGIYFNYTTCQKDNI
jgi:hypothetical protein